MTAATPPPLPAPNKNKPLGILYLVLGIVWLPMGFISSYMIAAMVMLTRRVDGPSGNETQTLGYLEAEPVAAYLLIAAFTLLPTLLLALSGFGILRSRWRVFSFVVAGLICLFFPLGTALGIWTFISLRTPRRQAA